MSALVAIVLLLAVCLVAGAGGGIAGVALGALLVRREFIRRMDMLKFSGPSEPQSVSGYHSTDAGVTPRDRSGSTDATDGGRPGTNHVHGCPAIVSGSPDDCECLSYGMRRG